MQCCCWDLTTAIGLLHLQIILGLQNFDMSNVASVVTAADKHVPKTNGDIPSFDEAFSDHRRLLDRLVLYGLVELKVNRDGNYQGSGGDADGRQEVCGLDGGVAVDVHRGKASLLLLHLLHPSTRGAGHVYMASSARYGKARGRHRPGPARAEGHGEGRDGVTSHDGGCRRSGVAC
ncbi:hypothetical protein ACQJBY_027471 [Aegilops geniculata]